MKGRDDINLIKLGPITQEATRELIAASLNATSADITDEFMKVIEDKAGGVPMFTRTFAAWLQERDLIAKGDGGTLAYKGGHKMEFPTSLVDTVIQRVDALDEDAKRLIKICACFGFEFRLNDLMVVAPQFLTRPEDPECINEALAALGNRLMVVAVLEERVEKHLKFTHQILCESSYNLMLASQRQEVHGKIADLFENSKMKPENLKIQNLKMTCDNLKICKLESWKLKDWNIDKFGN